MVVASNRAAAGVYEDTTGPLLVDLLLSLGFSCDPPHVVPDGEPVAAAISAEVEGGASVVLTTGAPASPRPIAHRRSHVRCWTARPRASPRRSARTA